VDAIFERGKEHIPTLFEDIFRKHGKEARTCFTDIQREGFTIEELP
jgi:hypothetical protein